MKPLFFFLSSISIFASITSNAQITNVVILDNDEIERLRHTISSNEKARLLLDSIHSLAKQALQATPMPLHVIHFEGLLETNPKRIDTKKSLRDMDHLVNLIYASYGDSDREIVDKAKEIIIAWTNTYAPDGNTINENKFIPVFWGYYLFRAYFNEEEKKLVESWMKKIAEMQTNRKHTPNNNWQAKRLQIIGVVGCVLGDKVMQRFSIGGFKTYINTAYFADGKSRDLVDRDALHYHFSGIKPGLSVFINLSKFDNSFDLFDYVGEDGGSIKRSLKYAVPYATGEKQRKEWINSRIKLDKQRAAAGIAEYQPGKLFNPQDAKPTFEWACYYNTAWYHILGQEHEYTATWIGLLNSPLVRIRKG